MRIRTLSKSIMIGVIAICGVICHAEEADLPNVLIIGDSISIGYTKPLRMILKGKVQVSHNPKNARDTATGLKKLDQWLGSKKWDVIHFNHGLHDMIQGYRGKNDRYVATNTGETFIPIDQYKSNLEKIVQRLKKTDAKLIFATTTPIPEGTGLWKGKQGYEKEYNKAALEVMKKHKIEINDLHALVLPDIEKLQKPKNVHFNPNGSKAMAKEVAANILKAIGQQ
jgi:lysophospholipase L1-like esterase